VEEEVNQCVLASFIQGGIITRFAQSYRDSFKKEARIRIRNETGKSIVKTFNEYSDTILITAFFQNCLILSEDREEDGRSNFFGMCSLILRECLVRKIDITKTFLDYSKKFSDLYKDEKFSDLHKDSILLQNCVQATITHLLVEMAWAELKRDSLRIQVKKEMKEVTKKDLHTIDEQSDKILGLALLQQREIIKRFGGYRFGDKEKNWYYCHTLMACHLLSWEMLRRKTEMT